MGLIHRIATFASILCLSVVFSPASAHGSAETPQPPVLASQLDGIVASVMEKARYPGVAVVVSRRGEVIYRKGFGFADLENRIPVTPDTVFPIGSVSKSFTGLAVMQLVERGKLSLDAPLGQYLNDYRGPARAVALRHLLNHTSGIPNYTALEEFPPDLQVHRTHEQVIAYFAQLPLLFAPGTRMFYSNSNTYLLGMVVEKVTGQTLADYLRANVFQPFAMAHTHFADYRPIIEHRSRGYDIDGDHFINAQQYDVNYPYAAGAIVSTVDDLLRYQQGVFEGGRVSERTRGRLLTLDTLADGTRSYYALGCLIVRQFEGHRKISHSGVISGFSSHYAYYPDDQLTIVVLTNLEHGTIAPYAMERKIARVALGIAQPAIVDVQPSEAELKRFAGDYDVAPFVFITDRYGFVVRDGQMNLSYGGSASGAPLVALRYQGRGRFVTADDDEYTFTFGRERPAESVVSEFYDGIFPAKRHVETDKSNQTAK